MPFHSNNNRGPRPDRESKSDKRQQDRIRQREADRRQQEKTEREKRAREADALRKRKQAEAIKARQLKAQEEAKRKARNTVKTPPKKTPSQELPRVMMKPPPSKPAKPKPATLFGMSIKAPKSDVQKKIDSGQATVIATKSSGKIVTTPTMDNKSLIMSKATQQKTAQEYKSSTANLSKAKKKIGNLLNPPSAPANPSMGVRRMDPSGTKGVSVLEKSGPVYKGQTLTQYKPKPSSGLTGLGTLPAKVTQTMLSPITGDGSGVVKIDTPVKTPPKQPSSPSINSGSLIYDFNKRMFGSYQGGELEQRKFLQGSKTPTVSSFIGSITSAVKNTGSWWRNAGDAQLKINKEMNKKIKSQLGAK